MKAGPYCGYGLGEIIAIKQREQTLCGKFFWGYGGVFCRPNAMQGFIAHAKTHNQKIMILFSITPSSYALEAPERFTYFTNHLARWEKLPKEVLLVGNKKAPHFAIIAKDLREVSFEINLGDYCGFSGMFPDPNKYFDSYFRYRVDKACGLYQPKKNIPKRMVRIDYVAELTEPYSVYIK